MQERAGARVAGAALLTALLCAGGARADEIDLSESAGRDAGRPATLMFKAEGGTANSPCGYAGGAVSYFNEATISELELGAGAGFPGVQIGLSVRKLFGDVGEYLVLELSLVGNTRQTRGQNALDPIGTPGQHLWSNIGVGVTHRSGLFEFGVTGGATVFSFTQTPQAYVHGGIGIGF